jgi:uncharacterized protein (TIGR03083 family)
MPENAPPIDEIAHRYARTAREGFTASAQYLRDLPDDAWSGPTGCAKWDMRALAGHIVGEAVWFPNLVHGATRGEPSLSGEVYEELNHLPPGELADRTEQGATDIEAAISEASHDQLELPVDLGFASLPIWMATGISAFEAALHNWDVRAGRDQHATIPTPWAQALVDMVTQFAPQIAHRDAIPAETSIYLLQVGDGVGPVTVTVGGGSISVEKGEKGTADATLHLTAEQYLRLLTGRLDLSAPAQRGISIEGDRERTSALNRVFAGVYNS